MAKVTRNYFRENFDGAKTANISPSKVYHTIPLFGISLYRPTIARYKFQVRQTLSTR